MPSQTIYSASLLINAGEVVAFPTETVYGLGADSTNDNAVRKIYALKGRPASNPLIVHANSIERLHEVVVMPSAKSSVFARVKALQALWPGPLTMVLPKAAQISPLVTNGNSLVGVRIPANKLALEMLALCRNPVAAPSANRSNRVSPTSAAHVREEFGDTLPILDGGFDACGVGLESTVVEPRDDGIIIHRPGFITAEQIELLAGPVLAKPFATASETPSPGQGTLHYAPTTPLFFFRDLPAGFKTVAVLGLREDLEQAKNKIPADHIVIVFKDPIEFAAKLYSSLRAIDNEGKVEAIAVIPPSPNGIGLAICDRLNRAASR